MSSNRLNDVLAICLLVVAFLLLLSLVPEFSIGSWKFRRIDLLADVRNSRAYSNRASLDTAQVADSIRADSLMIALRKHCPPDITCLEDYSDDSTALHFFVEELERTHKSGTPLRIAFYGDSFIEGDVFCGNVRDTLQALFGGQGVGYVPITSEVAGFRNTIRHEFGNWQTFSMLNTRQQEKQVEMGPAGLCFIPLENNWVQYKPSWQRSLRTFNTIGFFYKNQGHASVDCTLNDTLIVAEPLERSPGLHQWLYKGNGIKSVKFQFSQSDSLQLFGALFESRAGIYVDNFSLRGNSGAGLYDRISSTMYTDFNRFRDYKLILLQYGLNVVLEDSLDYSWYAARMIRVVNKLKKTFKQKN